MEGVEAPTLKRKIWNFLLEIIRQNERSLNENKVS